MIKIFRESDYENDLDDFGMIIISSKYKMEKAVNEYLYKKGVSKAKIQVTNSVSETHPYDGVLYLTIVLSYKE